MTVQVEGVMTLQVEESYDYKLKGVMTVLVEGSYNCTC